MVRNRRHAKRALDIINENLAIVRAERKARDQATREDDVTMSLDTMQLEKEDRDGDGDRHREVTPAAQAGDKIMTDDDMLLPGETAEVPWRLEGAYTSATALNPGKSRLASIRLILLLEPPLALLRSLLRRLYARVNSSPPIKSSSRVSSS